MNKIHYSEGMVPDSDEVVRNLTIVKQAIQEFERVAQNGGTLELEIDRYGHVHLKIDIKEKESI